jgi:hypothetical protein
VSVVKSADLVPHNAAAASRPIKNLCHFPHALSGLELWRHHHTQHGVGSGQEQEEEGGARWGPDLSSRCYSATSTCSPGTASSLSSRPIVCSSRPIRGGCSVVSRWLLVLFNDDSVRAPGCDA